MPIVDVVTLPGWRSGLGGLVDGDDVLWQLGRFRGDYDGDYNGCWISGTLTW
jgi:hypothetical protein